MWVRQPCWPTVESHSASPAVEAFHRSSSPSSCLPAAVPSAGPGPVMAVRQPERHQTSLLSPPPHSAACAEWIRLSLTTPAVEASHRSSSPSSCLPAAVPSAGPGPVLDVRQPAAQRTSLLSPPPHSAARAEWRAHTMEAFGGHASRPASLGVASRGNELLSPVRQTGQPTQQTTVPAAQQHSPAHAVPVVVQAVSQGGLHASPGVKLNPDDQVATFARMQGHLNPGMPRYYHMPEGAHDFVPGGATGPPPSSQSWWDTAAGLSPHGCCDAQGRAGCCPTGKSPGPRRPGAGLEGSYASPMGHVHAAGPARGGCSPAVGEFGPVGVGQGSCGIRSAVGESTQTLDVQAVCL